MERREDGPDTTSIKPMSSLRAKFENMAKEQDATPTTPAATKLPTLDVHGNTSPTGGPDTADGGRKSADWGMRPPASAHSLLAPSPHPQRPATPAQRPSSMISGTPTKPSPPLVKVNSPRSPHKTVSLDMRPTAGGGIFMAPLTPDRTGDSGSKGHTRSISRATTPALEARMSAFLQAADMPNTPVADDLVPPPIPSNTSKVDAKSETSQGPPSVNRAAKPKVPVKPPVLAKKPSNLTAPEASADTGDKSTSPFTTPPDSGASSPAVHPASIGQQQRARGSSHASAVSRIRADSNASWVQRIRGDSDASFTDRVRAGSNASSAASFVEPSTLPDNWFPPPKRTSFHDQESRPLQRAPTMPARYRRMDGREAGSTESLGEDAPRLPARPELQTRNGRTSPPKSRSGRTSPLKAQMLAPKRSVDGLRRAASKTEPEAALRIPAVPAMRINTKSALSQGFATVTSSPATATPTGPPAIPAPRRSVDTRRSLDRRREPPPPPPVANGRSHDDQEDVIPSTSSEQGVAFSDYPDGTRANRRAPKFKQRPWQIPTEYDTRLFAVCGEFVCTTGYITKVWNVKSGEQLLNMEHRENVKVTSIVFKPSPDIEHEGNRIWIGTNTGDIHEIDVPSQQTVKSKSAAHTRREVIRMFRYASELWTLDDGGELLVWKPDHKGMPSLDSQYNNWRLPKGHSFSIAVGKQLWIAIGKDIRVYAPSALSETEFQLTRTPLTQAGAGDVTAGATLNHKQDLIYFGHSDGKVSIYNRHDFSCMAVVNVSVYRISCMAGVGEYLWAGYSTGMACVYDTSTTPWVIRKDWKAHEKQMCSIIADPSAMWKMGKLNVITLGLDNMLRIWDGMLQEDWLEARMQSRDSEFCKFRELTAAVLTWNAGACKPGHLQHSKDDSSFFRDYLTAREAPDIFIFGFQELVDLENKKVTAKSFFKSKKKEPDEQQHMSHQYRAWRDHIGKCLDDFMPTDTSYTLVHTASMVGLFTCIFVKSTERNRIRNVHASEVKRGMGGRHGNKGAIIVRMVLDDSSICMVNCHLAAGQTQTMHRNNDIAEILEASTLPPYPLNNGEVAEHSDVFASGGDGSMVMDHEICILNGDLNYRIDTMGRDSVIRHVQQGNLARLLERDQLLLSRRKNPGFRLRAFQENQIRFAPTYKYDVHTDDYDTSEKRRSPAWCDRILYRGLGKVNMDEYRRWDQIRVSDHRPVSGRLRMRVKTVDADKREIIWEKCTKEYEGVQQRIARAAQLEYLTNILGLSQKAAVAALQGG